MRSRHGNRAGLGVAVAMVLGALALALPSLAAAQDRNHHDNRGEFKAGDNPRDADTDNDGVTDGEENAGTIASFDTETGKLTITLFGGDTVSGIVTDETRLRCGNKCDHGQDEDGGDDSGASASNDGGDNSGPSGQSDDEQAANCSPDDLVVGATVAEAELELEHGVAT